jgi:hypothetical protein
MMPGRRPISLASLRSQIVEAFLLAPVYYSTRGVVTEFHELKFYFEKPDNEQSIIIY